MNKKVPLSQLQCYAGFVYKSTLIESDFHKDISRVAQNGVGSPTCEPIRPPDGSATAEVK